MSYLVGPSDTGVGEEMIPWANYDTAYSFRVGMSPAVCNGFLATGNNLAGYAEDNVNMGCDEQRTRGRYFTQQWTTSFV